jgi:hypothetical protein
LISSLVDFPFLLFFFFFFFILHNVNSSILHWLSRRGYRNILDNLICNRNFPNR